MPFNTSGAASGAAAGASFGPWGAVIGGLAGGFLGGGGSQNAAPPPPPALGSPATIPGASSPYGSIYQDPVTGQIFQGSNVSPTSNQALQNQMLMSALMGQQTTGAGSQYQSDYSNAMAQLQAQMQQLNAATRPPDYTQIFAREMAQNPQAGPAAAEQAARQEFAQAMQAYKGNQNVIKQQMAAVQQNINNLQAENEQVTKGGQNPENNPLLQYLSQGKYNTIANQINQSYNNAELQQQQELANRGLSGSSMSDLNRRQLELQRGTALGNALQQVGAQDFQSRLGLLGYLQGANQQEFQNRQAENAMGLNYNQLASGLGQNYANVENQRNAAALGFGQASDWAKYNQNLMQQNFNQQQAGQLGSALGSVDWNKMFSGSAQPSGGGQGVNMGGNLAANPQYNYGSVNAINPYSMGLNYQNPFQVNMSAAGGK